MDYRKLDAKKLQEEIAKLRQELRDLRIEIKSQNLGVVSEYRRKKADLAKALTILGELGKSKK
ncbi:50S ribosomal protein L29 [Candidatus Dojkabacteria bacterium]|nr:50S ribosomal protein L29 [Candidatus Dojkabacteria bacterium]